jgi:Zn-dependent metalloprotease
MKNIFSSITAIAVCALFLCILTETTPAQNKNNELKLTQVNQNSKEYGKLKNLSLNYLNEELLKQNKQSAFDYKVLSIKKDGLGLAHTKMQQTYKGIPVIGGEAIVHTNQDNSLYTITNNFASIATDIDTQAVLSVNEAVRKAFEAEKCSSCSILKNTEPQLMIFAGEKESFLVYKIEMAVPESKVKNNVPVLPIYYIDAKNGESVFNYNNLQTQNVTNTGSSLYSGNVSFTAFQVGAPYGPRFLENLNSKIGTFNGSTSSRFMDFDGVWNDFGQQAAVDAHWGAEKTLQYYGNFGRNGVDGNGGPLTTPAADGSTNLLPSIVHYGTSYNNAFWDGSSMTYGDGDGSFFSPLVSIDVVGHELTHGITQFSAGLQYWGESGGLNEAASDIFGNMVERYAKGQSANNWKVGEEIFTPGTSGDALRYMNNPTADGGSIDHYSNYYNGIDVHYSSGIANNEFFLLSQGGTHRLGGSMTGIGADKAAYIWYYALTNFMTSTTNFAGARTATMNAATVLYGPVEANAVAKSWCLVGVGSCVNLAYQAHVQNLGWLGWVYDGATAGTTGQNRRMEAVQILWNNAPVGVYVQYRAHVSGIGWMPWVSYGNTAGTTGQNRQMEAVQAQLVNAPANCHIFYRAHTTGLGWMPWVSDGAIGGTTGQNRRMEALQAVVNCQ